MPRWPNDDPASLKAFYGDPERGEPSRQLVPVVPPFQMYYDGQPIKKIMFHRKAAPALLAALNSIWDHYGRDQKTIDRLGISKYNGAFNHRKVRGSATKWSNHAYGAAIDINAEANGLGAGKGNIPQPVIDAFKAQGALWGGDYRGRTDPMHFEFCSRGNVRPVGIMGDVQADGDSDTEPVEETTTVVSADAPANVQERQAQTSAEADTETRGSWLKRKWKGLTGWLMGGGATGAVGFLYSPWAIVAVFGCLLVIAIIVVLFMGPNDVRAWVRKQVS